MDKAEAIFEKLAMIALDANHLETNYDEYAATAQESDTDMQTNNVVGGKFFSGQLQNNYGEYSTPAGK